MPSLSTISTAQADIGVFGGSGFYEFLSDARQVSIDTPYGPPSDQIMLGTLSGKRVAFLPRHGRYHELPPHKINYRANVWAFKQLGVRWVISPCAAGSLQPHIQPGQFVLCDQYVDRTSGRADTFYDGPVVTHVSGADPYCAELRQWALEAAQSEAVQATGLTVHPRGTVVVIQGPRFSTRAESKWFRDQGWEVINMTQYPEVHLVKELEMSVVNIALITDYDTGVEGVPPVSHESVLEVFQQNNHKLKLFLMALIGRIPTEAAERAPAFAGTLANARVA
jgi:5'-methylthioadenosine phosphorylase